MSPPTVFISPRALWSLIKRGRTGYFGESVICKMLGAGVQGSKLCAVGIIFLDQSFQQTSSLLMRLWASSPRRKPRANLLILRDPTAALSWSPAYALSSSPRPHGGLFSEHIQDFFHNQAFVHADEQRLGPAAGACSSRMRMSMPGASLPAPCCHPGRWQKCGSSWKEQLVRAPPS